MEREDEFNEPYLPERYKLKVREKQRRRRARKIFATAIIVIALAIVLWVLAGVFHISLQGTPVSESTLSAPALPTARQAAAGIPVITTHPVQAATPDTTGYIVVPGVPDTATDGSLSLEGAVTALRDYFPENDYVISSVNYSAGSSRSLFGFTIRPVNKPSESPEFVVFIDATAGIPYASGQETATFPQDKVKAVITSAFPDINGDAVRVWFFNDPKRGIVRMFRVLSGNATLVSGSLDTTTGKVVTFTRNIPSYGRPEEPVITMESAQNIAGNYIRDQNGGTLPLNLTSAIYEAWGTSSIPAAGQYVFIWQRIFLNYPVDTDTIRVVVDTVNGDIIGYDRLWTTQDYAFSQTPEQAVAKRDATFAVMREAKTRFPASAESIRILSVEMRWNNRHDPGTTQRPGTVPLAWKVVFDDDAIRANPSLAPGIGWVDIQTGNVTEMEYHH